VETNSEPTVVIVDDEEMVLTSLNAYLTLETDYRLESFTDPEQALNYLHGHLVDVVISDYLMPKMNGIELLGEWTTPRCYWSFATARNARSFCGACEARSPSSTKPTRTSRRLRPSLFGRFSEAVSGPVSLSAPWMPRVCVCEES
jgi:DNA-binding LytR/AlgR family response regulator